MEDYIMKKIYMKPTMEIVNIEVTKNLLIAVSNTTQSNESALGRGFDFDDAE